MPIEFYKYEARLIIAHMSLTVTVLKLGDWLFPGFSDLQGFWVWPMGFGVVYLTFKTAKWVVGPSPLDDAPEEP